MKLVRLVVVVALAATAFISFPAGAKPPTCQLVTDDVDDVDRRTPSRLVSPPPQLVPEPAVDIVSADIAADASRVTAVVRVRKLAATSRSYSPSGLQWSFDFRVGGAAFSFLAQADPAGKVVYQASYQDGDFDYIYPAGMTGVLDLVNSEVRITAPVGLLASQATFTRGTKLTGLSATTGRFFAVPNQTGMPGLSNHLVQLSLPSDDAASMRTYVVGTRSCVALGR